MQACSKYKDRAGVLLDPSLTQVSTSSDHTLVGNTCDQPYTHNIDPGTWCIGQLPSVEGRAATMYCSVWTVSMGESKLSKGGSPQGC